MINKVFDIIVNVTSPDGGAALSGVENKVNSVSEALNKIKDEGLTRSVRSTADALNKINARNVTQTANSVNQLSNSSLDVARNIRNANRATDELQESSRATEVAVSALGRAGTFLGNILGKNAQTFQATRIGAEAFNEAMREGVSRTNALQAAQERISSELGITDSNELAALAKQSEDLASGFRTGSRDALGLAKSVQQISDGDIVKGLRGVVGLTNVFRPSFIAGRIAATNFSLSLGGVATGLGSVAASMAATTLAAVALSREFRETAQRTGVAAEELSELRFQLEQTSVSARLGDLQEGLLNVTERFGEASQDAGAIRDALIAMGLSVTEITSLSFDGASAQFEAIRTALQDSRSAADALFRARELGAEDLARILPTLLQVTEDQRRLLNDREEQLTFGDAESQVERLNEAQFAVNEVVTVFRAFITELGSQFAPTVSALFSSLATGSSVILDIILTGTNFLSRGIEDLVTGIRDLIDITPVRFLLDDNVDTVLRRLREGIKEVTEEASVGEIASNSSLLSNPFGFLDALRGITEFDNQLEDIRKKIEDLRKEGLTDSSLEIRFLQRNLQITEAIAAATGEANNGRGLELQRLLNFTDQLEGFDNAQFVGAVERFFETGNTPEQVEEFGKLSNEIVAQTRSLSSELDRYSASFAAVDDRSEIRRIEEQLRRVNDEQDAAIEKANEFRFRLIQLGQQGLLSTTELTAKLKEVQDTVDTAAEAVARTTAEEQAINFTAQFNIDNRQLIQDAEFDVLAEARLELLQRELDLKIEGLKGADQDLINSSTTIARNYFNQVTALQLQVRAATALQNASDFDFITDISADNILDASRVVDELNNEINSRIAQTNDDRFKGLINESTRANFVREARLLGQAAIEQLEERTAQNRIDFAADVFDLSEIENLDVSGFTDELQARLEIAQLVREEQDKYTKALEKNIINEEQASQQRLALANATAALNKEAQLAIKLNQQIAAFEATDFSGLTQIATAGETNPDVLDNSLLQQQAQERREILTSGLSPQEQAAALASLKETFDLVSETARERGRQALANTVQDALNVDDVLSVDVSNATTATLTSIGEEISRATQSQINILDDLLLTQPNLTTPQKAAIQAQIQIIKDEARRQVDIAVENIDTNDILQRLSIGEIDGVEALDSVGAGSAAAEIAEGLGSVSSFFQEGIDAFGFDGGNTVQFPELDIDFAQFDTFNDAVSAQLEGVREARQRIRDEFTTRRANAEDSAAVEELREEEEKVLAELNRISNIQRRVELPVEFAIQQVGNIAQGIQDVVGQVGGAINTLQQNELANDQARLRERAEDITNTRTRLREAIEAGNVAEVASQQTRLNGLLAVQRKEEAQARSRFEKNKKLQLAMAKINIATGVAVALATGGGFPLNLFAAAAVAAQGKTTLDSIKRTTFDSGSGLGGLGTLGGNTLSNDTDLNGLSSSLTAQELIDRGITDSNDENERREVQVRVELPDDENITSTIAKGIFNSINEQITDGQISEVVFI